MENYTKNPALAADAARPARRIDVLGTAIVGMLGGASRHRHFDAIGGDAVAAEMFGLKRMMSCDSVRRNLGAIPEKEGLEWIWDANLGLLAPLLEQDYVLELDPTVKPLYGRQEGAEIGYSPSKPGRPSHCCHTLCIARLRLVLGVVIHAGDETSGVHSCGMLDAFRRPGEGSRTASRGSPDTGGAGRSRSSRRGRASRVAFSARYRPSSRRCRLRRS